MSIELHSAIDEDNDENNIGWKFRRANIEIPRLFQGNLWIFQT